MESIRSHPFVLLFMAACVGIGVDRYSSCGMAGCWVALASWVVWRFLFGLGRHQLAGLLLLFSVAMTMATWHHMRWRLFAPNHVALPLLQGKHAEPMVLRVRVASLPESTPLGRQDPLATVPRGVETRFAVTTRAIRRGRCWQPASGRILVRVQGHVLGICVGDEVEMFGQLVVLPAPQNPGEDDLRFTQRVERVLARMEVPHPDCLAKRSTAWYGWGVTLGRMRAACLGHLDHYVGDSQSRLAGALLLGARHRLSSEETEIFFHTGTIHLLAISGLHVGILAGLFFVIAKHFVPRRELVLTLLMAATVIYCGLTGMRAPVLRASILVHVICLGLIWRRAVRPCNALATAALLVLALRPGDLFRSGAQLSFLAVAALIWLAAQTPRRSTDPLDELIARSQSWPHRVLRQFASAAGQLLMAGLVIWIVTLPLVMHRFHLVSPIAIVLNVLLTLPVMVALVMGFAVLLGGAALPPLAGFAGAVCGCSLEFVQFVVSRAHEFPGAFAWVAGPTAAWCAVFYLGVGLIVCTPRVPSRRAWAVAWATVWIACPLARELPPWRDSEPRVRCTFLAMGHGCCVVLELPGDYVVMYDAGRMGSPQRGVHLVSSFLWHRRISRLDAVILSHADADHYNALPELLERFPVGQLFVSPLMFRGQDPGVNVLRAEVAASQVPWRWLRTDDVLRFAAETSIRVLHPLPEGVPGTDNANSVVLEICHGDRRILLPGDLESQGLADVMAEMPLDVDVLMAPHHGSLRSAPRAFSAWCAPEFVVISSGHRGERTSQQRGAFEQNGCQVFATSEVGAITVEIWGHEMTVTPFHNAR